MSNRVPIALQLYSVRDDCAGDLGLCAGGRAGSSPVTSAANSDKAVGFWSRRSKIDVKLCCYTCSKH